MGLAANLGLATTNGLTDLRQYINCDLVFSNLKFEPLSSEIVTVKVVIPNGLKPILLLASTYLVAILSRNPFDLATPIGFAT